MPLSRNEVLRLFFLKRSKDIKSKDLAREVGLSESAISRFFKCKLQLTEENEEKLINYINNVKSKSDFS